MRRHVEEVELCSMHRSSKSLGENVSSVVCGGAVANGNGVVLDVFVDKVMANVDVFQTGVELHVMSK